MQKFILVIIIIILIILLVVILWFPKSKFVPISLESIPPKTRENQISVLTANVGNSNLLCQKFFWKLCIPEVEKNISQNIKILNPDIVVLQEIFSNDLCKKNKLAEKSSFCVYDAKSMNSQAERLLGDSYTIVCDSNNFMQCIGIKKDFAQVIDCSEGNICFNGRTINSLDGCNPGFTIFAISVNTANQQQFDIVNIHLNSMDKTCRKKMLEELISNETPIIQSQNVLLMGDFNIDLYQGNEESKETIINLFSNAFKSTFVMHEALDSGFQPIPTFQFGPLTRTLDYVFSNFLKGNMVALGRSKGTTRLDGGWGMDHTALFGILEFVKKE